MPGADGIRRRNGLPLTRAEWGGDRGSPQGSLGSENRIRTRTALATRGGMRSHRGPS